jgi:hypothetical protein
MSDSSNKVWIGSLKIALVVGTILCVVNQYDAFLTQQVDRIVIIKMAMNYTVPFIVATYSKYQLRASHHKSQNP